MGRRALNIGSWQHTGLPFGFRSIKGGFAEPLHIGIELQTSRNPSHDFQGYFFSDKVIGRINGQLHEFERRGKPLGVDDPDKPYRFTRGCKKSHHIIFLNACQVSGVNVVTAVLAVPRLVPKGDDLPPNNGPIVKKVFEKSTGLNRVRKIVPCRGGHLISRKRKGG